MEIQNSYNTPSFGMAFIKPTGEFAMRKFKEDVYGKRPVKLINKALVKVVKQEKKNLNYDVYYDPGTSIASGYFGVRKADGSNVEIERFMLKDTKDKSKGLERINKSKDEYENAKNPIVKFVLGVRYVCTSLKEAARVKYFKPTDLLPAALRKAINTADMMNEKDLKLAQKSKLQDEGIEQAWR